MGWSRRPLRPVAMPPQLPLPKRKKRKRRRRRCLTTSLAPVPTTTWDSVSSTKEPGYRVIKARLWGNGRRRRRKGKSRRNNSIEDDKNRQYMFHSCFITSQVSVKYVFSIQFRRGPAYEDCQIIFRFSRCTVYNRLLILPALLESNFSSGLKQFKGIFIVGNDFLSRPGLKQFKGIFIVGNDFLS